MIELYEKQTQGLSDEERSLIPYIVKGLSARTDKAKAITNKAMCDAFNGWGRGYKITGARMRKMLHYIQVHGLLSGLVSCGSKGYYVTSDREERTRYVASLLARANSIRDVADSVMKQDGISLEDVNEYNKGYYYGEY